MSQSESTGSLATDLPDKHSQTLQPSMFWPSGGSIPSETSRITASGSPDALGTGPGQVTKVDLDNLDFPASPVFLFPGCWRGPVATTDLDNLENLVPDLENKISKIGPGHRPGPGDQDRS